MRVKATMGDIVLLRLYTGEFLIGRFDMQDATPMLLKARIVILQPTGPGQMTVNFVPVGMPFFNEEDCARIQFPDESHIQLMKTAPADMAAGYTKSTSGIHLPGAGIRRSGLPGLG